MSGHSADIDAWCSWISFLNLATLMNLYVRCSQKDKIQRYKLIKRPLRHKHKYCAREKSIMLIKKNVYLIAIVRIFFIIVFIVGRSWIYAMCICCSSFEQCFLIFCMWNLMKIELIHDFPTIDLIVDTTIHWLSHTKSGIQATTLNYVDALQWNGVNTYQTPIRTFSILTWYGKL